MTMKGAGLQYSAADGPKQRSFTVGGGGSLIGILKAVPKIQKEFQGRMSLKNIDLT